MSHQITFDAHSGIIIATLHGIADEAEVRAVLKQSSELAIEHQCTRWMNDLTDAEDRLTVLDIFALPKYMEELGNSSGIMIQRIKIAVVIPARTKKHLFAEVVGANRGQNMRVFNDVSAATQWLQSIPEQKRSILKHR